MRFSACRSKSNAPVMPPSRPTLTIRPQTAAACMFMSATPAETWSTMRSTPRPPVAARAFSGQAGGCGVAHAGVGHPVGPAGIHRDILGEAGVGRAGHPVAGAEARDRAAHGNDLARAFAAQGEARRLARGHDDVGPIEGSHAR